MTMAFYDAEHVEQWLDFPGCIAIMRDAMMALSYDDTTQPLRQILNISHGIMFGLMPGSLRTIDGFGAKLVSVAERPVGSGRARHRGIVVLFSTDDGEVACIADAEAVTRVRTACASAAATAALSREDARVLAIFGTGTQAAAHVMAMRHVRQFDRIIIWGRSFENATALAASLSAQTGLVVEAEVDGQLVASAADVICTVSGATEAVLLGRWVRPGTHVNLVGSSYLGPVEVDSALVASARYIADYKAGVLAQASELAVAQSRGLVSDDHVAGEIGEVFGGTVVGRESDEQITIYKSLGHVVQDLAATAYLHRRAVAFDARSDLALAQAGSTAARRVEN